MKNKYPKVSVVMLNYNGLKYLKRTIPPILKLDYLNYEFIIVDNGSTDGSIEFIKKFKKIKLIENKENLGYGKGKNIGVKEANGEYILLLDNDIIIREKTIIKNLIKYNNKNTAFVYTPVINIGEEKSTFYGLYYSFFGVKFNIKKIKLNRILLNKKISIGAPDGKNMFFSKEKWIKIGGFDESQTYNLDDVDIGPRAYILGYENYLYTKTKSSFLHLGIDHQSNVKSYVFRFKSLFSGHARSMIKNYNIFNLIIRFPLMSLFLLSKSIKYSIKYRSVNVFFAFIYSIGVFLKNLPDTLKQRKIIQSKRIIKEDIFLKIKPPKFD